MTSPKFSHGYGFDPAYGHDLSQLLAIRPPEPPADFAAFWQARFERVRSLDPQPRLTATGERRGGHAVHELTYTSTDGVTLHGWLLLPHDGAVTCGVVIGHGYGGRDRPDDPLEIEGAALLFPCFRGLGRSRVPGLAQNPNFHVLHHIEDRDRYVIGGCVDDLWLAVSALEALVPQVSGHVAYLGISFGGGIGALAAPWDARIRCLALEVPTFGHQALRLTLPCTGSGEAVRIFERRRDFHVMATLAYYDAATSAGFLQVPTLVAAALFDPAVPPPGQFAVHNAVPAPWRRLHVLQAGHFEYPEMHTQRQELEQEVARFVMQEV